MKVEVTPERLETPGGSFPLHEFHLALGRHEWTVQHAGVVLTKDDESHFVNGLGDHLPYGVAIWPSSIALAHELASRGADGLLGRRVLELGAGIGLPGIVAATLGARVVQTDRQEAAMALCRANGRRNGVSQRIEYRKVDWTAWQDDARYDFILGADILYGGDMHPYLYDIFEAALAPGGRVVLADPLRVTSLEFLEGLQADGWHVVGERWNLGHDDEPRIVGTFSLARPGE